MADGKNKLAQGLAEPPNKPIIKRGQGMRLSTDEGSTSAADLDQSASMQPTPSTNQSTIRTNAQSHDRTNAQSHDRTSAIGDTYRVNRGYKLREDLIKACRAFAIDENRNLYAIMEEALQEYLERHAPELLDRYNKKRG